MHFKRIKNFDNYVVFKDGSIFSLVNKKFLKVYTFRYATILLTDNNKKQVTCQIHRLIATAFIPNPDNLPQVNHIDGNKLNNDILNLEWCDRSYNAKHAYSIGLAESRKGSKVGTSKLNEYDVILIKGLLENGYGLTQISKIFNVSTRTIYDIRIKKYWKHVV